jgi:hypothetical protein
MKHNKIQLKTKKRCKKREKVFLFRKLTDISKQNDDDDNNNPY